MFLCRGNESCEALSFPGFIAQWYSPCLACLKALGSLSLRSPLTLSVCQEY